MPSPVGSFARAWCLLALLGAALAAGTTAARAQTPSPASVPGPAVDDAADLVVLSGAAVVPRGQIVGAVVVFHGRATVLGVVLGDVVVFDGPVTVGGQVSGSVIAADGAVRLGPTASVRGDVMGARGVRVEEGAVVAGQVRESVPFTPREALSVLGRLLGPLAVACSVLALGLALLWVVPRGADRVATAARTAPLISLAWGVGLSVLLPVAATLLAASLVGLPVGVALALGLALLFLTGAAWTVWTGGRLLVGPDRSRWMAFLAGWGVAVAVSLVPYLNVAAWTVAAVGGVGAMAVATWRARGRGGRHRPGYGADPAETDAREGYGERWPSPPT